MHISDWIVGILAVTGLTAMGTIVAGGDHALPIAPPVAHPPTKPFPQIVSGAGLVEAASQNIAIGTPLSGIVSRMYVTVGAQVKAGESLFSLDMQQIDAEVAVRSAAIEEARARLLEAEALHRETQDQFDKVHNLPDPRIVSREEIDRRTVALRASDARLKSTQAHVQLAEAEYKATCTQRDRMIVRAPISGEILQLNVRVGEYASAGTALPLVVMGDTSTMHVRVDIDENDAWRFRPGARAVAYVRGSTDLSSPAAFVRVEPLVIPKRSLTGASSERVDTRVLQAVFSLAPEHPQVYVGQQMDVMIEAGGTTPTEIEEQSHE